MDSDHGIPKTRRVQVKNPGLVLPDLSYEIVGALFDVYNEIGAGHRERVYQQAVAAALRERKIAFVEQRPVSLTYKEKKVGMYRLDFLIDDKVILELKQGDRFRASNIKQIISYLKSLHAPLAILANFTAEGVLFRRIVNSDAIHS